MKRICEVKGRSSYRVLPRRVVSPLPPEITSDITVYRYSKERSINYLKAKVERLSQPTICEMSTTVVRHLAKNGLMDDGKEDLLNRESRRMNHVYSNPSDTPLSAGRTKAACELLSQYLPSEVYAELLKQYE